MIHWTRQIKEVLSSQDALQTAENSGPLEEIEFWKNRCADLSGISQQLDKPGVKRITHCLELAKSSYVAPFLKLSGQIKVRSSMTYREKRNVSILFVNIHNIKKKKGHSSCSDLLGSWIMFFFCILYSIFIIYIEYQYNHCLELAKSSYVGPFVKLSGQIKVRSSAKSSD